MKDGLLSLRKRGSRLLWRLQVWRCEMPTVRCSMTTQEQDGLPKDPSVLRTVVRDADQNVGVYASVLRPGRVRIDDDVRIA